MFPSIRECPWKWTPYLFHKRVNHYSNRTFACVSYVNSAGSSVPQEDILVCKSKGSVHTLHGLCGVTAGSTVAVAFEPAGPGFPPPAWPISGNRYRRVPHAETDASKLLLADPCVPILCEFLEASKHCRDCSRPPPDDFPGADQEKVAVDLGIVFPDELRSAESQNTKFAVQRARGVLGPGRRIVASGMWLAC